MGRKGPGRVRAATCNFSSLLPQPPQLFGSQLPGSLRGLSSQGASHAWLPGAWGGRHEACRRGEEFASVLRPHQLSG